ncbi:MAG TPA: ATP-grasp domain-containing protein, partial [Gammaproteobacteria bacterium]|nr:ATP-grasp domain-containing protein [Gammaproteobacteria bacterium]
MNLHEYQAKQILREYDLPVPNGYVITTADAALNELPKLQTAKVVIKAQVHAGGRGKAGGVKIENKSDVVQVARNMLHKNLVTYQTDSRGQPVNSLLLEETYEIAHELYLGAVIDRSLRRVVIMASTEGGVDIEKVAAESPEKIVKFAIDPLLGIMPYQCRELAYELKLAPDLMKQFSHIVTQIGKMFVEKDFNLLEINPLVITKDNKIICLDAKINVDDNAAYRQPQIRAMWDPSQDDPREIRAQEWGINYIALNGNIGC